eukprot:TRINITY_DN9868_c0_g2_i7.p3 TRINITY_DN9868_c0_g2~~TRINITY_DN9868_c0_g2_i7.p3  ORF type:complete len:168 (-),score=0.32 TRINITY_DN9868_c0_g2_i7:316-819(-)
MQVIVCKYSIQHPACVVCGMLILDIQFNVIILDMGQIDKIILKVSFYTLHLKVKRNFHRSVQLDWQMKKVLILIRIQRFCSLNLELQFGFSFFSLNLRYFIISIISRLKKKKRVSFLKQQDYEMSQSGDYMLVYKGHIQLTQKLQFQGFKGFYECYNRLKITILELF